MKTIDFSTIAAVGVLVAALFSFMAGFGIEVPLWIPASIPLGFGVGIFGLRAYVAFVGEDSTSVDERLATAEKLIASVRAFPAEAPTRKE